MHIRISLPLSGSLRGPKPGSLHPNTTFTLGPNRVNVTFLGDDALPQETDEKETIYGRWISHVRVEVQEEGPEKKLVELVLSEDKADLLAFLAPIANRVLRAIRNCALASEAKEINFRPWQSETLFRKWNCETSEDGKDWKQIYSPRDAWWDALFGTGGDNSIDLNMERWSEIEESIQDDLQPGPEQEFVTNALEHMRDYNFRLALIEAIVCLEIVLSQFTEQFLLVKKGLSQNRVNHILSPQIGLSARVSVLLDLILSPDELNNVRVGEVLKAVNWRNGIIHKTGHLPPGLSDQEARDPIFATLELALFLSRRRDEIAATPELQELARAISSTHKLSVPTIQPSWSHRVSVSFRSFLSQALPSEVGMLEVIQDLCTRLRKRDKRFVPADHLHVTFGGLLGGVRAVWSKGRLEVFPPPVSFVADRDKSGQH
jgi:hypothetical protein